MIDCFNCLFFLQTVKKKHNFKDKKKTVIKTLQTVLKQNQEKT